MDARQIEEFAAERSATENADRPAQDRSGIYPRPDFAAAMRRVEAEVYDVA